MATNVIGIIIVGAIKDNQLAPNNNIFITVFYLSENPFKTNAKILVKGKYSLIENVKWTSICNNIRGNNDIHRALISRSPFLFLLKLELFPKTLRELCPISTY